MGKNKKNNKVAELLAADKLKLEDIKSDFITVASHQLRTPISAIRWSLDTLLSGQVGNLLEKQREIIREAYQNNNFMVKVVGDLLRVSRLEEKGLDLMPKFIDLKKIIKNLIAKHKNFAQASNCTIDFDAEPHLPKVYVDPLYLEPVLNALIDNAIRYTKQKGRVKIGLKKSKKYVLIKIKDNGIGIPENQKHLVFSKFFRGLNAIKTQTEGLGLNLYLAKKVIEASGGKIGFISQENKMTIFFIYLPTFKASPIEMTKRETEKPEDILRKEREFVSITVHELKAPLGTTKWSLEMLKSQRPGKLNGEQIELINQIYRGNERLLVLVRDLLNLAKLQEGKFEVEPKMIILEEVVSDVINGFKAQAKEKKIKIQWPSKKTNLPKIIADPNRIAQVITNLLSNAIKYTPRGGKVSINLDQKTGKKLKKISNTLVSSQINFIDNKKGYLILAVKDTGIGISPEEQNKLFTRFFRSKKVLSSESEGTGLGLYITKSIINLHQGDIWFTSKLGKGSTFYISLPIA
ncbi:MAG: HAMP domain-containing sensor histidine kinase [Patescibacteria group bacterium]|jgi:signal transduction histidine kinase